MCEDDWHVRFSNWGRVGAKVSLKHDDTDSVGCTACPRWEHSLLKAEHVVVGTSVAPRKWVIVVMPLSHTDWRPSYLISELYVQD